MEIKVKKVIKRDGRVTDFDPKRIKNAIKKAMISVNKYSGKKLNKVLNYALQIINEKYSEENIPHVEDIQDIVEFSLVKFDLYEVAKAYILYRKEREKIRQEKMLLLNKDYLDEVDKTFSLNAIRLLAARYLTKNEKGEIIEGPKDLFKRVAVHVVIPDILYDKRIFSKEGGYESFPSEDFNSNVWDGKLGMGVNKGNNGYEVVWNRYHLQKMKELYDRLNKAGKMKVSWSEFFNRLRKGKFDNHYREYKEYYDLMISKKFIPNSPTLFNAGTRLGQLSACFVLDINDDINSIMEAAKEAAIIFKTGGGIGINYSKLRPEGDMVFSTAGVASGPVSFMRIIDTVTDVIKQGGCISTDNYISTSLGLIKLGLIPLRNPRDENILPFTVFDGEKYIDAFLGSLGTAQELIMFETEYGYKIKVTYDELMATINTRGDIDFKEALHIKNDDYLVLVLGGHKGIKVKLPKINVLHFNSNKVKIPDILNEDLAEILGFYMGDGCWSNGRLIFSFNLSNKELINHFIKKIKSVFNLDPGEIREKKNYVDIVWFSKSLEKYFEERHWKKDNSANSFIPDDIFLSEKEVIASFLRGLFNADGYIRKDGYIVLYSTSEKLIHQIQIALLSIGILSTIRKLEASKINGHLGNKDVYILYIIEKESIKRFSEEIGFIHRYNDRRIERALNKKIEYVRKIPNISQKLREIYIEIKRKDREKSYRFYRKMHKYMLGYRNLTYDRLKRLSKEFDELKHIKEKYKNLVFVKIKKITKAKEKVFHLETLSGKYVANGFLIHNRRRGANMGILEIWHPDIEKFITSKSTSGVLENFNISVMITPDFWEKYENDEIYQLVNPRDKEIWREVNARQLFRLTAEMAWKTGDPGVLFMDNINKRNILRKGMANIRSTNPCGEEPLYPYESCNLGSINLYAFIQYDEEGNKKFNWEEYIRVIRVATRFLDNVIDINQFPFKIIERSTRNSRKIGLGLMGLADMLFALSIPYNSEEGFKMMKKVSEYLTYYSMDESVEIAKKRSTFPLYNISFYPDGEMPVEGFYHPEEWTLDWNKLRDKILKYGIRNAETTTIAPTGSISMIADSSSGVEPQFALVFEKRVTVGNFFYVDSELEKSLQQHGLYDDRILKKISDNGGSLQGIEEIPEEMKKIFIVSYDIPWWDHVRAQAEISKWICAAVSKTINMPNWVTIDDVEKAYLFAYKLGAKGITIYRDGSKAIQVLITPSQKKGTYTLEIENNTLDIMKKLGIQPPVMTKTEKTLAKSTLRILPEPIVQERQQDEKKLLEKYSKCPECGGTRLIYTEGCLKCLDCGWSLCTTS